MLDCKLSRAALGLPNLRKLSISHVSLPEEAQAPVGCDSWRVQLEAPAGPRALLRRLRLIHEASDALQTESLMSM